MPGPGPKPATPVSVSGIVFVVGYLSGLVWIRVWGIGVVCIWCRNVYR